MPNCRSCNAPIIWARTASNKLMPLDAEPTVLGNCVLENGVVTVLGLGDAVPQNAPIYRSHFATCPTARKNRAR